MRGNHVLTHSKASFSIWLQEFPFGEVPPCAEIRLNPGLGIEHMKNVWLDMGPKRDVYDNGLMFKNSASEQGPGAHLSPASG